MSARRLGSRGSDLALWQSRTVLSQLARVPGPEWLPDVTVVTTRGDVDKSPYLAGGVEKGFFTKELEVALLDGRIDLVVPHRDGGQSHVYIREAGTDLRFRQVAFGPADAAIRVSAAADLDADGHMDIVAIDERTHHFSTTLEEHNEAVARYRQYRARLRVGL